AQPRAREWEASIWRSVCGRILMKAAPYWEIARKYLLTLGDQHERAAHDLQPEADGQRQHVVARGGAQEPDQARPERARERSDRGGQPQHHGEIFGAKLALDDQRGQRDDVADRKTVG